jgi:hypothetical protein
MTKTKIKRLVAAAAVTAALGATAHAQSADALIDKLIEKGILTVKEAQELRDEADKNFSQAYAVKSGMGDWVQALKFSGDIRGRYERFDASNPAYVERQRLRYRMRFAVVAQLMDDFEAGFRLTSDEATGSFGGDPISGNSTYQDNASKKFIFIDQAYGKWTPLKGPSLFGTLTLGKMENPLVFSDMVFDSDYTPEGLAANLSYVINDRHTLKLNSGYFVLDEIGSSVSDPDLLAAQVRWDAAWSSKLATTLGVAYMGINSALALGNSAVPNINRGNTRDGNGNLVYGYHPVVLDAAATYTLESFPMYTGAFPIKVGGDYMHNFDAPSSADNYAYSVGIQFGKSGKKGTWDLSYTWKWLGANAWWEELVDSDFGAFYAAANSPANSGSGIGYGAGTNVKGHVVRFAYSPSDSFTLSVKWFLTSLINRYPSSSQSEMSRLQLDASWKF